MAAVGGRTAAAATSSMPGPPPTSTTRGERDGERAGHQPRARPADPPEPGARGRPAVPVAAPRRRERLDARPQRERGAGALGGGGDRVAALLLQCEGGGEGGI